MNVQADAASFLTLENSYARLPERFFARLPPTPVAAPRLVKLNVALARELGLDADSWRRPRVSRSSPATACRRARADRHGLCGPPVRRFRPQLGDGARDPAGRGDRPRRQAPRHPAQGLGPDAVLAARRRARGARAGAARIHRQRGDVRARRADDACARGRDDGRTGHARDGAAGRGADARRVEPYPRRHVPVLRGARRSSRRLRASPTT